MKVIVRLGYVANALRLENCSPSKTITYSTIQKIAVWEDQKNRLLTIARENLQNTLRILKANVYDQIMVYRLTSKLVPLSTHPQFTSWDYCNALEHELQMVGDFVKSHNLRVSLHPDHYTLLNSPTLAVQEASLRDLEYHVAVLEAMRLDSNAKLIIHVGGKYDDKAQALYRFKQQYTALPSHIKQRILLENDDRCFSATEVLRLCQELAIPMVLDVHHHQILNYREDLADLLPKIFATWGSNLPKVHISSPKTEKAPRSHADYLEASVVANFLAIAHKVGRDFDMMLEAKQKDLALFKLGQDIQKKGFNLVNNGTIELT